MSLYLQKVLPFQKGLPFPKGIINIISDYAHTLFYVEELKDKTKEIYDTIEESQSFDLSYVYACILLYENKFIICRIIGDGSQRRKLFVKENERRVSFGLKTNSSLWPGYNKVYQSY